MQNSYKAFKIPTEQAMLELGVNLAQVLPVGVIIFLHGELGVGKTTLVRGVLRGFHFEGTVKSPTYTLVEEYSLSMNKLYHFDLYRLSHPEELEEMGIRDYFTPESRSFIEWPERGKGYLPTPDLNCTIDFQEYGRQVAISAQSHKGKGIIEWLINTGL
jgi:tRNA threonylcarbamoyladenosine biosynthesis protein TsaE